MHARQNSLNPSEMRRVLTEQASQARERSLHFGEELEEEKMRNALADIESKVRSTGSSHLETIKPEEGSLDHLHGASPDGMTGNEGGVLDGVTMKDSNSNPYDEQEPKNGARSIKSCDHCQSPQHPLDNSILKTNMDSIAWVGNEFFLEVFRSPGDDEPMGYAGVMSFHNEVSNRALLKNIELVSQRFALIGHCCPTHTNNIVPLQDEKLWLSKEIHETHSVTLPSGKRRIVTTNLSEIISKACRKEGFEVSIRNRHPWEHGSHITLNCRSFGRKSTMSRSSTANNVHTKAPEEASHVCPWVMHVYYDKRHDRFFIRKNSACSWGHKYHSPVREEDRESNARELGENALKVFKSLSNVMPQLHLLPRLQLWWLGRPANYHSSQLF